MKKRNVRPSPAMIVACVALFVALGGTALAATYVVSSNSQVGPGTISGHHPPAGSHTNVIAGSVSTSDLADGLVNSSKLAGGAVRAPALGPISVVRQTATVAARQHGNAIARCPAGTRLIGGGANDNAGQNLTGSFPFGDNGWGVNYRNDFAGASITVTAYALCLDG
jgi:hypothetical protein